MCGPEDDINFYKYEDKDAELLAEIIAHDVEKMRYVYEDDIFESDWQDDNEIVFYPCIQ